MIWNCIGSGPSVTQALGQLPPARSEYTITTNAGINVCPSPDYYFVTDTLARTLFRDTYLAARATGTKIVTPRRNDPAMMECADILIDCDRTLTGSTYHRGRFAHPALSGLHCIQYALNCDAKVVRLYGYDGYPPDQGSSRLNPYQEAWINSAVVAMPHVTFIRVTADGPMLISEVKQAAGVASD